MNTHERMNGMNKRARVNVNSAARYIYSSEQYEYRDRDSESQHGDQSPVRRDCSPFTHTPPVQFVHTVHGVHAFTSRLTISKFCGDSITRGSFQEVKRWGSALPWGAATH